MYKLQIENYCLLLFKSLINTLSKLFHTDSILLTVLGCVNVFRKQLHSFLSPIRPLIRKKMKTVSFMLGFNHVDVTTSWSSLKPLTFCANYHYCVMILTLESTQDLQIF